VRLVWPSGRAVVARNLGTATGLDDDPAGGGATFALGDVSVVEGDDLSALAVFPVRLSSAQAGAVSVNFGTADGTATVAGGDYEPRLGTLTFAPGITSATIFVKLTGDYRPEANETFSLVLSGSSGPAVTRATGTGTIVNDD
jgi:Calx-beta domain-containing protein